MTLFKKLIITSVLSAFCALASLDGAKAMEIDSLDAVNKTVRSLRRGYSFHPMSKELEPGELGLSCEDNRLYSRVHDGAIIEIRRSDNPKDGLISKVFDRIVSALKTVKAPTYTYTYGNLPEEKEEKVHDVLSQITSEDEEILFQHMLLRDYIPLREGVAPDKIVVVFDFHGVIVEQASHKQFLTLRKRVLETLQYLKNEGISTLIATAWDDFNEVIRDSNRAIFNTALPDDPTTLREYFAVDPEGDAPLEKFSLGPDAMELQGYKNGRIVALKYKDSKDPYFRQKAFAVELIYPEKEFEYILFVDDSKDNHLIFADDYQDTSLNGELLSFYLR